MPTQIIRVTDMIKGENLDVKTVLENAGKDQQPTTTNQQLPTNNYQPTTIN